MSKNIHGSKVERIWFKVINVANVSLNANKINVGEFARSFFIDVVGLFVWGNALVFIETKHRTHARTNEYKHLQTYEDCWKFY